MCVPGIHVHSDMCMLTGSLHACRRCPVQCHSRCGIDIVGMVGIIVGIVGTILILIYPVLTVMELQQWCTALAYCYYSPTSSLEECMLVSQLP